MDKIAFCSVALTSKNYGDAYIEQQKILEASVRKHYPNAELFFWTNALPEGARPFLDSLYGFKAHAVQVALDAGFKKIVWFDTACILHDRLDWYDQHMTDCGIIAVQDDNLLTKVMSDRCLKYYGWNRPDLAEKHLVGGSFYYFDFEKPLTWKIFEKWKDSEVRGLFGSQDEESAGKLQGHRADESVMALSMYYWGAKPFTGKDTRYNTGAYDQIVEKKHFK